MSDPSHIRNRTIIGLGLVLCILVAVIAAYFLGLFGRPGGA